MPARVLEIVYRVNFLNAKKVKHLLHYAFQKMSDLVLLGHLDIQKLTQPEHVLDIIGDGFTTLLCSGGQLQFSFLCLELGVAVS